MNLTLTDFPLSEALRYMGCPKGGADADTLALTRDCAAELLAAVQPKWLYRVFSLRSGDGGVGLDCGLTLPGRDLAEHLRGCDRAALLCATLGAAADTLIRRAQAVDMARALALDACATAAVEAVCDRAEAELKKAFPDCQFPFRFSPGYGDLPIELQRDILTLLDTPRQIGLCATDTSILTPRKSVTAVLGIGRGLVGRGERGCASCNLRGNCQFQCKENHHESV